MKDFDIDPRLIKDCHPMGHLRFGELLLMDNALYSWFILVPRTDETEFYLLDRTLQINLIQEINDIATFIKHIDPTIDKINIATIGNIVRQLHIHIVGRHEGDAAWPGVVWGTTTRNPYSDHVIRSLRRLVQSTWGPVAASAERPNNPSQTSLDRSIND